MVILLGPAVVVMCVAMVLRLWLLALLVAVIAFVDGMRYACCVD